MPAGSSSLISRKSSAVSSTSTAFAFSSSRVRCFEPGIGTMSVPCASCFFDRGDVDGHGIVYGPRVSARKHNGHRQAPAARLLEDEAVALAQALARQPQPTELIVLERIRAREIEKTLRRRGHHLWQRPRAPFEAIGIAGAVGKADIERAPRLPGGIVPLLVHREGENARIGLEDERRAVAVMPIPIEHPAGISP